MQMTYLQLCQYAHRLMRSGNAVGGSLPTAIPQVTTVDQTVYDIIDAIPRAWEWIQNQHVSWTFMRKQALMVLNNGIRIYNLTFIQLQIPDYYRFIPMWAGSSSPYFQMYDSTATAPVDYVYPFIEYQEWRGLWDRVPRPAARMPNRLTEHPNRSLEVDPTPAATPTGGFWVLKFDYRIKNQNLALSTDVPILPAEYHEMIAWVAVRMLSEQRMNTGPLIDAACKEIDGYMNKLKAEYLPLIQIDMTYA